MRNAYYQVFVDLEAFVKDSRLFPRVFPRDFTRFLPCGALCSVLTINDGRHRARCLFFLLNRHQAGVAAMVDQQLNYILQGSNVFKIGSHVLPDILSVSDLR